MECIGIFFDVDGTLSDSYRLGFESTNEVLRRHNISAVSEEAYHDGTKYTTPHRLAWHVTGDPNDPIGLKLGAEFDDLYVQLVSTTTAPLYHGICSMLEQIKSKFPAVRFAALSNACTAYVEAVLTSNGLQSMFQVGLGADCVTAPKPAPNGLLQICEKLNIPPTRCVYIGDSPTDGQAASSANMHSIGVTWGSHAAHKVESAFVLTVHSVEDLTVAIESFVSTSSLKTDINVN